MNLDFSQEKWVIHYDLGYTHELWLQFTLVTSRNKLTQKNCKTKLNKNI